MTRKGTRGLAALMAVLMLGVMMPGGVLAGEGTISGNTPPCYHKM